VLLNLLISLLAADAPAAAPAAAPKFDAKAIRAKALARASESDAARSQGSESARTDTPASHESGKATPSTSVGHGEAPPSSSSHTKPTEAASTSPGHGSTKAPSPHKAPGSPAHGASAPPAAHGAPKGHEAQKGHAAQADAHASKESASKGEHGAEAPAHGEDRKAPAAPHSKDVHGSKPEDSSHGKAATGHEAPEHGERKDHGDKASAHAKPASHEPQTKPRVPACGEIPRSATWKARNVTLHRSLKIPAGMTLWLTSGTELRLGKRDSCQSSPAPVEILVEGRLVIEGNAINPVRIAPAPGTREWGGIKITGSARIDHLRLQGGQRGLWFHGSTGEVRSSLLDGCVTAVQVSGGATPSLSHLVITKSQGAGLYVDRSSPSVTGTLFLENKGIAAWFAGTGLTRFENNAFWGNIQGDVAGSKRWGNFTGKGPVKTDQSGNLQADPVLVGSLRDNVWRDSLAKASRRPAELPFGDPPWALSGASPLRGKGPRNPASPWSRTDIGLYGLDQD